MVHLDDHHLLDDWYIHGPKTETIYKLVEALARKGMRVQEIEDFIETALRTKLAELEESSSVKSP